MANKDVELLRDPHCHLLSIDYYRKKTQTFKMLSDQFNLYKHDF
jgi:hypothetical protein